MHPIQSPSRAVRFLRTIPVLRSYLVLLGIIALCTFLAMGWFGSWPSVAITHLILAVGVFPMILGAILYFTPVLTRSGPAFWPVIGLPFLAMVAGGFGWFSVLFALSWIRLAAPLGILVSVAVLGWMGGRASRALGAPHPGLFWYQAALICLVLGLSAILATQWFPEQWVALRTLHRYLNMLGFVGLTAVGTLQVLLPTVGGYADPKAGQRLRFDLKYAVAGTFLMAIGEAYMPLLGWVGVVLWGWVLGRLMQALRGHFRQVWRVSGAAVSLVGALLGFSWVLIREGLLVEGSLSLPLFLTVFLFPLVTGALAHLLPLWLWPGLQTPQRDRAQRFLGRGALLRLGAFAVGGAALSAGDVWGVYPVIIALLFFLGQVVWVSFPVTSPE